MTVQVNNYKLENTMQNHKISLENEINQNDSQFSELNPPAKEKDGDDDDLIVNEEEDSF